MDDRSALKLNIGAGPQVLDGWTAVDAYHPNADVTASIYDLPFEDRTVTHVYLGHVLEHLPWDRLPAAMTEVCRVMRPEGVVMAVGPCIERAVLTKQPMWLLEQIIAKPDPVEDGGAHQWTATELLTVLALRLAFANVTPVPVAGVHHPEWPNSVTDPWQTAVRGVR